MYSLRHLVTVPDRVEDSTYEMISFESQGKAQPVDDQLKKHAASTIETRRSGATSACCVFEEPEAGTASRATTVFACVRIRSCRSIGTNTEHVVSAWRPTRQRSCGEELVVKDS